MQLEKFELGKCYEHSSGRQMHICGIMDTIGYGTSFCAEEQREFSPVTMNDKDSTVGWREISKETFFNNNFSKD